MSLLFAFITSTFVTMLLVLPLMRISSRFGIVDIPDQRKIHHQTIPRVGGIAMVCGVFVSVLLWCEMDRTVITYLMGAAIILFFGVWDDRSDLNYKIKFLGQIIAVGIPVIFGDIQITQLPFLPYPYELPVFFSIPLTVFVLLGIVNAINLSDGLDGLAAGTILLALGLMAVLAYAAEDRNGFIILITVCGSILGFLRYNTYPAQVFMGDSGSQFLGFSAGFMAVLITQESNTALSPALPLLILGLPVLDTLMVMTRRISEGRSPFLPDKKHLHHRLLELGINHYEAVFWIYVVQTILLCAAYLFRYESDTLILSFYVFFSLCMGSLLYLAETTGLRIGGAKECADDRFLAKKIKWLRDRNRLASISFFTVLGVLSLYILSVFIYIGPGMTTDIGLLTLFLIGVSGTFQFIRWRRGEAGSWYERGIAYTTIITLVYLTETSIESDAVHYWLNILLIIAAIAVAAHTRYHMEGAFKLTSLDFLVILVAITLYLSPVPDIAGIRLDITLTKLLVLFYVVELILNRLGNKDFRLHQ